MFEHFHDVNSYHCFLLLLSPATDPYDRGLRSGVHAD